MKKHKVLQTGNLVFNGNFEKTDTFDGKIAPVGWYIHDDSDSIYTPQLRTDAIEGNYSCEMAMDHTASANAYAQCLYLNPGIYTCYAQMKPYDSGANGRFVMHCYDEEESTARQNQVHDKDFTLTDGEWTECLFTFTADDFSHYLHYSPRSQSDLLVLVDDCKLVRGDKTIEEMRQVPHKITNLAQNETTSINGGRIVGMSYINSFPF